MNNLSLKIGDTFDFAIRDWACMTHESSAPCIVLQTNIVISTNESLKYLTRSAECTMCDATIGLRTTSAMDNVKTRKYFQILFGNEKWLVDYRFHHTLAIVTCGQER